MQRAATWVADQFRRLGFTAEIVPTGGHPLVYGRVAAGGRAPTALVYGHYDVQPPDPLDKWISPPFEPVRREGNIVARGATDDKGQVLTHIKSAEAWIKTRGSLPINLKYHHRGRGRGGQQGARSSSSPRTPTGWRAIASSSATAASSARRFPPLPTRCAASPITNCG